MNITATPQQYHEKMQGLKTNYLQRLKKNLRDIRRLKELLLKDLASLKDLQEASLLTHNLTGSGATFGFPEISHSAAELQQSLKTLMDANRNSQNNASEKQILLEKIELFYEASRLAVHQDNVTAVDNRTSKEIGTSADSANIVIAFLARKENVVSNEMAELKSQGYKVVYFDSLESLKNVPGIAIAVINEDLSSEDQKIMDEFLIQEEKLPLTVPVIFKLKDSDFRSHLRALRLGANVIASDTGNLSNIVLSFKERLIKNEQVHVFVVTKDEMLANLYEHILQQAGMRVTLLKGGKDPLKAMISDPGRLVLVDFDLSFCRGNEFIEIINQNEDLRKLKSIFMATPEEIQALDNHFSYTTLMLKPFTPEQLLSTISQLILK